MILGLLLYEPMVIKMPNAPIDLSHFEPTRAAARARLDAFLPYAGQHYEKHRNYDDQSNGAVTVSGLSPYLRYRVITEQEVIRAVLGAHGLNKAEKFIQEVVWRTYWKGWLEMRPSVWTDYLQALGQAKQRLADDRALARRHEQAVSGHTDIPAFNEWAEQLMHTGYLHNHARMWVASIWIFTLKLPWELGAAWFLEHLLDGDPASNTLSWRWVAGLQTRGKTYQATQENIERFTRGRHRPVGLAQTADALDGPPAPKPQPLLARSGLEQALRIPSVCVVHHQDIAIAQDMREHPNVRQLLWWTPASEYQVSQKVSRFQEALVVDAMHGTEQRISTLNSSVLASAVHDTDAAQVVITEPPVGSVCEDLNAPTPCVVPVVQVRRDCDNQLWPHATKGFFPFKEQILRPPSLIETIVQ
jgi:deoxyribodipyrimidine photo-lyase